MTTTNDAAFARAQYAYDTMEPDYGDEAGYEAYVEECEAEGTEPMDYSEWEEDRIAAWEEEKAERAWEARQERDDFYDY